MTHHKAAPKPAPAKAAPPAAQVRFSESVPKRVASIVPVKQDRVDYKLLALAAVALLVLAVASASFSRLAIQSSLSKARRSF